MPREDKRALTDKDKVNSNVMLAALLGMHSSDNGACIIPIHGLHCATIIITKESREELFKLVMDSQIIKDTRKKMEEG